MFGKIFNNITRPPRPRYCAACGSALAAKVVPYEYDTQTGLPITWKHTLCCNREGCKVTDGATVVIWFVDSKGREVSDPFRDDTPL